MLTIFHVSELVGGFAGLFSGLLLGQQILGWPGAIVGAGVGFYCGFILGRLPYVIGVVLLKRELKKCETATLKRRLDREYWISTYIIALLLMRGESVKGFRTYIFSLLNSDFPDQRLAGWKNLLLCFPELADRIKDFKPFAPTEICRKKVEAILMLTSFANADDLAQAAAIAWLDEIETANRAGKSHCVALSGGRIAKTFYSSVVKQSQARSVSLQSVHFFWADERCVPPDDAESNFLLAQQLLFAPLKISANQIHRVRGELPPEKATELATEEMMRIVPNVMSSPSPPPKEERAGERRPIISNPLTPAPSPFEQGEGDSLRPVLDLIILGIGEDGHVASLFPSEPEAMISDAAVFRAIKNSPKPPPNRVTLGYQAIAAAKQVWVLASGTGKERIFADSLKPDGQTPFARVLKLRSATKIFTDIPALKP